MSHLPQCMDSLARLLTFAPWVYGVTVATKFSGTVRSPNVSNTLSISSLEGVNFHLGGGKRERRRKLTHQWTPLQPGQNVHVYVTVIPRR